MTSVVVLTGFLGAGKTTSMLAMARALEARGRRVAVVTNDQGEDLIDSALAELGGFSRAEITGGCFCCRYDALVAELDDLVRRSAPDVVLAEAVGSCTDVKATVVRPLERFQGFDVRPLAVVVDPFRLLGSAAAPPEVTYLFDKQLEDGEVVAVNKDDLLDGGTRRLVAERLARFGVPVVFYSARTGDGLDELLAVLLERSPAPAARSRELVVDYATYGRAEAELAWSNVGIDVRATDGAFRPGRWAEVMLAALGDRCRAAGWEVGHVKVLLGEGPDAAKASLVAADRPPSVDRQGPDAAVAARGFVNARVRCSPGDLDALVGAAVAAADTSQRTRTDLRPGNGAFAPAQPVPTHRLVQEASR